MITLTKEQLECKELMAKFIKGKYKNPDHERVFILDGFAGTGKSTLVSQFLKEVSSRYTYNVLTYTGKASRVLFEKGLKGAQTIHSFLYDVKNDEFGNPEYFLKDINDMLFKVDVVIIDESSFISDDIYEDLLSRCKKVIFVGDSYQLSLDRSDKLSKIDYKLDTPLRFQGSICELATLVRTTNKTPDITGVASWEDASHYDIIICYRNNTRVSLNMGYRKYILGKTGTVSSGEKIMFLNNSRDYFINGEPIINGLILTLDRDPRIITKGKYSYFEYKGIYFWFGTKFLFLNEDTGWVSERYSRFDTRIFPVTYAYVITCHKAQGSEWDNVLLLTESTDPHYTYTGVTRAKERITLCRGIK